MATRLHRLVTALVTFAIATALAAPAAAKPVDEVVLECDLRDCERRGFVNAMLAIAGVTEGSEPSPSEIAHAEQRLLDTGFFASVTHRDERTRDGRRVVFEARGADVIRKVRIRAGSTLGSELRRRIFLRSGETWTGDPQLVNRQEREIVAYFEELGYFGTRASIRTVKAGPHEVDIIVRVDRGRRMTVDRIYVRGNETLSYDEVTSVLLGRMNLMRNFTVNRFESAQQALLQRYREVGHIQARITLDEYRINRQRGTVDLFVEVREGPPWEITFNGNRLFDDDDLLDALTFYETGFIDETEIQAAVAEIQARYETVGHFFADVGVRYSSAPGGLQRLTFDISERQTVEIGEIRFEGLDALDEAELREVIETREYDLLATGGYLQRSRLDQDVARVEAACRSRGFLQASVSRVVLVAENDGRDLTVVFHVVEGPRTRLASVDVMGVSESEERRLERALAPERRGDDVPFDPVRLREEQSRILSSLHGRGYPHARVESECRQGDSDAPVPCAAPELPSARRLASSQRDLSCAREMRAGRVIEECRFIVPDPAEVRSPGVGGGDVHVIHRAEAGERVSFGQLLVRGNFRTRRRTIVREMQLEPGTPYDLGALFDGQSRVRQLGLFDSVRVSPIAETDGDSETGVNHVIVQLEEASSRFIEHRITLEARAATPQPLLLVLSNEPTFRDLNIGGRARELRIFGNFDLDILEPQRVSDGEFRAGAGIRYIARRFYLTRRQSDPWEAQAQIAYDYDLLAIAPAPLTRELAFDARIREESDAVDGLFFEVGVNVSRTETLDQSDPLVADTTFDPALILSIAPRVTFDTRRDNPLNPDRGFFGQIEVELADDILGVLDSERFTKITTRASGFVPLGQGFVLGLNGRVGMAFGGILSLFRSSGRNALPLSERYALGGVTTVRGFAEGGVSSLDADVYGGDFVLNGNIELRYPFLRSISLDAAIFVDSGQLAAELSDLTFDGFRTTAGMGLRWIVADLIPIVIDYGAVLDRRPGEGFGRLHFNVGYTF